MICPNCKKQIPDDANRCFFCDFEIKHEEQLPREIKQRRWQRWFFYFIFSILFISLISFVVYEKNQNTRLIVEITNSQENLDSARKDLEKKETEIKTVKDSLNLKESEMNKIQIDLTKKEEELKTKTLDFKKIFDENVDISQEYKDCKVNLDSSEANIYNLIIKLGEGVSNENLLKIPLADANMIGDDLDKDGLPDVLEYSFGTNKEKKDTDNDGHSDKDEVLAGYNPLGEGRLNIDYNYANQQKGKILLQVDGIGEAWYVSTGDAKRYFLGRSVDGFEMMRNLDYWTKKNKEEAKNLESKENLDKEIIDKKTEELKTDTVEIKKELEKAEELN